MKLKGKFKRELCTSHRTTGMFIEPKDLTIVHFNFHERSELTSTLTSMSEAN